MGPDNFGDPACKGGNGRFLPPLLSFLLVGVSPPDRTNPIPEGVTGAAKHAGQVGQEDETTAEDAETNEEFGEFLEEVLQVMPSENYLQVGCLRPPLLRFPCAVLVGCGAVRCAVDEGGVFVANPFALLLPCCAGLDDCAGGWARRLHVLYQRGRCRG